MSETQYFPRLFVTNAQWMSQNFTNQKDTKSLIEYCASFQIVSGLYRMPRLRVPFYAQTIDYANISNTFNFTFPHTNKSRQSAFMRFFIEKNLTPPREFQRSVSLSRPITQQFIGKFISLMQRDGHRKTAQKAFGKATRVIAAEIFDKQSESVKYDWLYLLSLISTANITQQQNNKHFFNFPIEQFSILPTINNFSLQGKNLSRQFSIINILQNRFKLVRPLYQFKFAKTDKRIRKFSRGKIGKYQCIVQYVPKFRRDSVVMHWLINEINFDPQNRWSERIFDVFFEFLYNSNSAIFQLNLRMLRIAYIQQRHRMLRLGQYRIRHR